jgi:hypothetical protein
MLLDTIAERTAPDRNLAAIRTPAIQNPAGTGEKEPVPVDVAAMRLFVPAETKVAEPLVRQAIQGLTTHRNRFPPSIRSRFRKNRQCWSNIVVGFRLNIRYTMKQMLI